MSTDRVILHSTRITILWCLIALLSALVPALVAVRHLFKLFSGSEFFGPQLGWLWSGKALGIHALWWATVVCGALVARHLSKSQQPPCSFPPKEDSNELPGHGAISRIALVVCVFSCIASLMWVPPRLSVMAALWGPLIVSAIYIDRTGRAALVLFLQIAGLCVSLMTAAGFVVLAYSAPGVPQVDGLILFSFFFGSLSLALALRNFHDFLVASSLSLALLPLVSFPLDFWAFAVVGDEYSFAEAAREIATWPITKLDMLALRGTWVYDSHPFLSSLNQSILMRLFEPAWLAWRIEGSLMITASAACLYCFFRRSSVSAVSAWSTTVVVCASSYLLGFSKIGYNNLQALLAFSISLLAAARFSQSTTTGSAIAFAASCSFCCYVYPAALYSLPVVALYAFHLRRTSLKKFYRRSMVVALGILSFTAPLLLQKKYLASKLPGVVGGNGNLPFWSEVVNVVQSAFRSATAFVHLARPSHFVTLAAADAISAIIITSGMMFGLAMIWRDRRAQWAAMSVVVMAFLQGATGRADPSLTRLFMMLPLWAFFATWCFQVLERKLSRFVLVFVVALSCTSALVQALIVMPLSDSSKQSRETLLYRFAQQLAVEGGPTKRLTLLTNEKSDVLGPRRFLRISGLDRFVTLTEVKLTDNVVPRLDQNHPRPDVFIPQPWLAKSTRDSIGLALTERGYKECRLETFRKEVRLVIFLKPFEGLTCPHPDVLHRFAFGSKSVELRGIAPGWMKSHLRL